MAIVRPLATKSADPSFKNVHRLGFGSYVGSVREALVNAETKAVVVTPFIDNAGVSLLREAWENRSAAGCAWEIYVRNADQNLRQIAAKNHWRLFEYPGARDSGMHAKIVSIDEKRVLLGSMNLLNKNMYSNLELGVDITQDPLVWRISRLEAWLQNASKAV